ncbi:hypothetical protein SPAN111604_13445 [Sphingomonas antarctica]|uniref:hypothetical protein n=1 Tax=Sphingomonas antarctica TaxID=2040274 RepID=UPI0039E7AAF4
MADMAMDAVIAAQAQLIEALDRGDVSGVEVATAALASALTAMRADPAWNMRPSRRDQAEFALRQCDAARMRVNYLGNATRERQRGLAAMRGDARAANTYERPSAMRMRLVTA